METGNDTKLDGFTVAIPTYRRPDALQKTITSILENTCLPAEIFVIDDDSLSAEVLEKMEQDCRRLGIPFRYHKKDHAVHRRGLSESKNLAAALAGQEIIFFLDDDVVLDHHYFAELMRVWNECGNDQKLIGVGGRIANNRPTGKLEWFYRKCFGLTGESSWDVNDVGFQVWGESVTETQKAYYIHGGVSSYRRKLLLELPFTIFSGGRTGLEDVEHCLHAKRTGRHFLYAPSAHLMHFPNEQSRESAYEAGKKESANRKAIFQRHCKQDVRYKTRFLWANVGWLLKKLIALRFREASGMMIGFLK